MTPLPLLMLFTILMVIGSPLWILSYLCGWFLEGIIECFLSGIEHQKRWAREADHDPQ